MAPWVAFAQTAGPVGLEIQVVEGRDAQYAARSQAYTGITVRVTDEQGGPVAGARVRFRMPATGARGTFAGGGAQEETVTDADGKAGVWGMRWGAEPGECRIAVFATAGTARAGLTTPVRIVPAGPSFEVAVKPPPAEIDKSPATVPSHDREGVDAPPRRPGVLLTRTEGQVDRIPSSHRKWVIVTLALGAALGSGFAYRSMQQKAGPVAGAVLAPSDTAPPKPAIGNPTITIGRP